MPYTVLIAGAASGLGCGFAQHYLDQSDTLVFLLDRSYPPQQQHTTKIGQPRSPNHRYYEMHIEMSSERSIGDTTDTIKTLLGGAYIDLVIHSAGIRGLVPSAVERLPNNDVTVAETLAVMDGDTLRAALEVNAVGTFILLQQLNAAGLFSHPPTPTPTPTLTPAPATNTNAATATATATRRTKVIVIASRMGSIGHNRAGGSYAYRASKAAQNALVRSLSIDLPHVTFALVHPGRVETGLTPRREDGAMPVEDSVGDMLRLIDNLRDADSGRFMDRFGVTIEW